MADAILQNNTRSFWSEVRRNIGKGRAVPTVIDQAQTDVEISNIFVEKYKELCTSVPYDTESMNILKKQLSDNVVSKCCNGLFDTSHNITTQDVINAIAKLKPYKVDGKFETYSDNLINASPNLYVHLSILFTCMLTHNIVPGDMLLATLVPIPKSRKKSLSDSNNYRSIALSSIVGKVLDTIIMDKNMDVMKSQHMQFGFKAAHSTTQCTFLIQEIVDYYSRNGSSVYLIMLDASRAFDRVQYTKLFRLLISRGRCPMYARLLANMYAHQYLRVKWNSVFSVMFDICNGVKQGGVLSPILFCLYIDELFVRLKQSGIGCHIGNQYAGAVGYADGVSLIAPSRHAAKLMLSICEKYAHEYDVFNSSKSVLITYNVHTYAGLVLSGVNLVRYDNAVHLGHDDDSGRNSIAKACTHLYTGC